MTDLPSNVQTCGVKGHFAFARLQAGDADGVLDLVPVEGLVVTLTPSPTYLLDATATPPTVIVPEPLVLTTDSNGDLRDVDGNSTAYVIASDDPDLNPHDWTYTVSFAGTSASKFAAYSAAFPAGETIDLSLITPIPSALGVSVSVAQAAEAAAASYAASAAASAEAAATLLVPDSTVPQLMSTSVSGYLVPGVDPVTKRFPTAVENALAGDLLAGRMAVFTPEQYGALGDGTTDDTTAIAACYAAARAAKGTVLFSNGRTYIHGDTINPAGTVTQGYGATLKHRPGMTAVNLFQVNDSGCSILGLTVDMNKANTADPGATTAGNGLYAYGTASFGPVLVRDVVIKNGHQLGLRFGTGASITDGKDAPDCAVTVDNTRVTGCDYGVFVLKAGGITIKNSVVSGSLLDGMWINLTRDLSITGSKSLSNGGHGIAVVYSHGTRINGTLCEGNGDSGIAMGGGDPANTPNRRWALAGNVCRLNGELGITVDPTVTGAPNTMQAQYGTLSGNTCSGNSLHGIFVHNASHVAISGNTCEGNTLDGISSDAYRCTFDGNTCVGNAQRGIAFNGNASFPNTGDHRIGANVVAGNTAAGYYIESLAYITGLQFAAYTSTPPE